MYNDNPNKRRVNKACTKGTGVLWQQMSWYVDLI